MPAETKKQHEKHQQNPRCDECGERPHDPGNEGFWKWAARNWQHRCASVTPKARPWNISADGSMVWRDQ
ncbi:MAG: hypothetical protein JSS51_04040 [Planctomycetes bacterium]|nr:hypothetical protein [Planctomycetota bacterium]